MCGNNPHGFHTETRLSKQDDAETGAELHKPEHRCLSEAQQAQECRMVDIPLQFCIRENLKNNAVKSYKQWCEKKSATNLMCMCKAESFGKPSQQWPEKKLLPKATGTKQNLLHRFNYNSFFLLSGINYLKIFKTIMSSCFILL